MTITVVHTVELTEEQIRTILLSLRYDYRNVHELGTFPGTAEMKDEIKSAFTSLSEQTGVSL